MLGEGGEERLGFVVEAAAEEGARQFAFVDVERLDAMRDVGGQALQNLAVFLGAAGVEQPEGGRFGEFGELGVSEEEQERKPDHGPCSIPRSR